MHDLVRALVLAAEQECAVGRTYFVAAAEAYSWREIMDRLLLEMDSEPPGGSPSASWRVTDAWKFWIGERSSTGASVPLTMRAPVRELPPHVGPS